MNDLKKKINFDPLLLYCSASNKNKEEESKPPVTNKETYNSTNRKYSCTVCGKRFFTNNSLTSHLEHHKPEELASPKCKEDNWKDRRLPNKGINCNKLQCNFIALDAIEYQKHFSVCEGKRVTKESNQSFCNKCDSYFSSDDHLKAHSVLSHPANPINISLKEEDTKQTIPDPVFLYISEIENGITSPPCMYPDSAAMKKRSQESDSESLEQDNGRSEQSHKSKNGDIIMKNDDISPDDNLISQLSSLETNGNINENFVDDKIQETVSSTSAQNMTLPAVQSEDSFERESTYNDVENKMHQLFKTSSSDDNDSSREIQCESSITEEEVIETITVHGNGVSSPLSDYQRIETDIEKPLTNEFENVEEESSETSEVEEFSLKLESVEESMEFPQTPDKHIEKNVQLVHSTPYVNNSESPERAKTDPPVPRKRGRKKKDKSLPTPEISSVLNSSERSVRNRKKLMLPDFEYSYDPKLDKNDSCNSDTQTEPVSEKIPEPGIRKRGRPRKYPIGTSSPSNQSLNQKEPVLKTTDSNETMEPECSLTPEKKKPLLPETPSEPKQMEANDVSLHKSQDQSWLDKINVSYQSSSQTQDSIPQKKPGRGRPPKKKHFLGLNMKSDLKKEINQEVPILKKLLTDKNESKIQTVSSETPEVHIKRKRGRPRKIPIDTSIQKSESVGNLKNSNESSIVRDERSEIHSESVTGIESSTIEEIIELSIDDVKESSELVEKAAVQVESLSPPPKRKRGRPRLIRPDPNKAPVMPEIIAEPNDEPEDIPETAQTEEDKNLKRQREFLEYMGFKVGADGTNSKKKEDSTIQQRVRKRGRRSKEEILKSRMSVSGSKNSASDRPYSIYNKYRDYSENLKKQKLKPKHGMNQLRRKSREERITSPDEFSDEEMSNKMEGDSFVSEALDDKNWVDSSTDEMKGKKPRKPRRMLKDTKKKTDDDEVPSIDMNKDETKHVDPELYSADIRFRARYAKIFKKVTQIPEHSEYLPDSFITCGRCKKLMTLRHYYVNHQISHYFLCWLDGEKELDMNEDNELVKLIQPHVNADAIRKKWLRFHCERCEKVMKSVIGYISHIRFCSKGNEAELLGTCMLCGKKLKPSSLRHHYVKFHDIAQPNMNAKNAEDLVLNSGSGSGGSGNSRASKRDNKLGFERRYLDKAFVIRDDEFWTSLKTSYDLYMCMGRNCRHMTLSKDDLKTHILNCEALFCEFSCQSCPFKTKYESEIIYHAKNSCKDFSDAEEITEAEEKSGDGRRVSMRPKKLKRSYDENEFFEEKGRKKRRKNDDDGDDASENEDSEESDISEDESDYDSDEFMEKKSRSNRNKKERSTVPRNEETDGLRTAFLNYVSRKPEDPLSTAMEIKLRTSELVSSSIQECLKVDVNEWETFPISDLPKYSPEQSKSMRVTFDGKTFTEYDLFQSDVVKGAPIAYVGGPIWAMSWAPLPPQISEQYLAVTNLRNLNQVVEINSAVEFPSLIQIWKFSSLDNISNVIEKPSLAWGIAHNFGAVWSVDWCPFKGFDESSTPSRLGILAVATSSGVVAVYSVPKLDCGGDLKNIVANPTPDLILKTKYEDVQCTRILWLKNTSRSVICGGFSNGAVVLWDVGTTSSILKKGKDILPYKTFDAHNAAIIAMDAHWIQNGRYLVTTSIDRIMKYWDLEDLSGPKHEIERATPITSISWFQQWAVNAVSIDNCNMIDRGTFICHPRDTFERKKTMNSMKDTYWSTAYSEWNDTIAISSCSGQVSVLAAKHLSSLTYKTPDYEKILTDTKLIANKDDEAENESVDNKTGSSESKPLYDCSSVIKEFSIKFCDRVSNNNVSNEFILEPDKSTIRSINKVCWNQNYNNFNWLALGYECGIIRVIRVERFDKLRLTKFYKMNESNSHSLI